MADIGTGYIVEVGIESVMGYPMEEIDFNVSFFVSETHTKTYAKEEMIRVKGRERDRYFILLDSSGLGIGQLMARTSIQDPVEKWSDGMRPVVITRYTGKAVGVNEQASRPCAPVFTGWTGEEYEEGYKATFRFWNRIPEPEVSYIYFGKITAPVSSMSDITADMIGWLDRIEALQAGRTSCGEIGIGETLAVAIPEDMGHTAFKDNGFGETMAFSEEVMGTNGGHSVMMDGVKYRIFGELMIVNGEMFIYVE